MQLAMKQLLLFPLEPFTVQRESKRRSYSPIMYLVRAKWDNAAHTALKTGVFLFMMGVASIPKPIREQEAQRLELVLRKRKDEQEPTPGETARFIKRSADSLVKTPEYVKKQRVRRKQWLKELRMKQSFTVLAQSN